MGDAASLAREARLMEPLYRMAKVVGQQDSDDAKVLTALAAQYIIDRYAGRALTQGEMQAVLRAVLLYHKDGLYLGPYLYNELQVKAAGWFTLLAADLPLTLGDLGQAADQLAQQLAMADQLTAARVLNMVKGIALSQDEVLYERVLLNEPHFLQELRDILGQ